MLKIFYKYYGIQVRELWFLRHNQEERGCLKRVFQAQSAPRVAWKSRAKETLVIDLPLWDESKIHKKTRYDIRRMSNDYAPPKIRLWSCLSAAEIHDVERSYNSFAQNKGVTKLNGRRLAAAASNVYYSASQYRESMSFHIYLFDENRVRLLYSWTRISEGDKLASAGLNKSHTACDINFFKSAGFLLYDFGGFKKARMNGIDLFKSRFGGESIIEHNFVRLF